MKRTSSGIFSAIFIFIFISPAAYAQMPDQRPEFGAYYYHRMTLFEALPNAPDEIIFLGDSITDGSEWSELFGSPRIKNRGISGDVTEGVLYRLSEVTESDPSQIFIMIGVNDLARGISVDSLLSNYSRIIDRIKLDSPNTEIFIQSILPVNDAFTRFSSHTDKTPQIKQSNTRLEALADDEGARFIDLFDDLSTDEEKLNPDYTEDGLHLNGAGYQIWKSAIEAYLDL